MGNPAHAIDFYKSGHIYQNPPGTRRVYSNGTPRGTRRETSCGGIIFFGWQWFILRKLIKGWSEDFFKQDIEKITKKYVIRMDNALGKGAVTPEHIRALHKLQYLPMCIKALPEGTLVPYRIPAFTMYNTHDDFGWLTQYLETQISRNTWKSSTSATTAFLFRRNFEKYYRETVGDPSMHGFIMWQGHDFSSRGMSYDDDAMLSGAAHLLSFWGTDTVDAIDLLEDYYFADSDLEIVGGSVPASEHAVVCAGGKDNEFETLRRLITEVYPSGIFSWVSDTWDFWQTITDHAARLKTEILNRTGSATGIDKVVFRPDTGNPADILCGTAKAYTEKELNVDDFIFWLASIGTRVNERVVFTFNNKYYHGYMDSKGVAYWEAIDPTPEEKGAVQCLWDIFGGSLSPNGYRMLNPKVGLIYGDSITLERQVEILERLKEKGWASTNVVLGIGSYTYQYVTRDTDGWAIKSTYIDIKTGNRLPIQYIGNSSSGGYVDEIEVREIFKAPKTGDGIKNSACGLLAVHKDEEGNLYLKEHCSWEEENEGLLEIVFLDGKIMRTQILSEIRKIVESYL